MTRQQMHRRALPGRQIPEGRRERPLQLAFVNAASALPCRPEPRSAFDNAARRENPSRPWHAFADPLRAVAAAARVQGGPCVDATEERLILACLALLEYVLEPLEVRPVGDACYLAVAKEVPEAIDAVAAARLLPTLENIARADRESGEASIALQLHRGGLRRMHDFVRPLGAVS